MCFFVFICNIVIPPQVGTAPPEICMLKSPFVSMAVDPGIKDGP